MRCFHRKRRNFCRSSGAGHTHSRVERNTSELRFMVHFSYRSLPPSLPFFLLPSLTPSLSHSRTDTVFELPSPNSHACTTFCFNFVVYPSNHQCVLTVIISNFFLLKSVSQHIIQVHTRPPYMSSISLFTDQAHLQFLIETKKKKIKTGIKASLSSGACSCRDSCVVKTFIGLK